MHARRLSVALLSVLLFLTACGSAVDRSVPTPPSGEDEEDAGSSFPAPSSVADLPTLAPPAFIQYCHSGFPLKGVYSPGRLTIKSPCAAVTGVVQSTDIEHDGDLHISLVGIDRKWVNDVNLKRLHHDLVVEAVPSLPLPAVPAQGARITVVGPWVLDTQTGWLEIHPAWAVLPA
jgi:hypothetical protein